MLKQAFRVFLDILYPKSCHICSKVLNKQAAAFDDYICADCSSSMKKIPLITPPGDKSAYQTLTVCYSYEGATKELIHRFKYENRPYLAKTIVKLMSEVLEENAGSVFENMDCLVPIPLHPTRIREREFNQAESISKHLSGYFKKPSLRALKRLKNTQPQITLSPNERRANVCGVFASNGIRVKGKNILLIDDVVTTSATVNEAARTLKAAGAESIRVLAFAKG